LVDFLGLLSREIPLLISAWQLGDACGNNDRKQYNRSLQALSDRGIVQEARGQLEIAKVGGE